MALHSHRRTSRRWKVNGARDQALLGALTWAHVVKLQVSPRGIKTIDKLGIDRVCQDILARGEKI